MVDGDTFSIYFEHGGRFITIGTAMEYFGGDTTAIHGLDIDNDSGTCKQQNRPRKRRVQPNTQSAEPVPGQPNDSRTSQQSNRLRKRKLPSRKCVSENTLGQQGSLIQKERAMARKGYGLLQFEDTGNVYMRMPNEKRVHFLPSRYTTAQTGSTSGGEGRAKTGRGGRGGGANGRGGRTVREDNSTGRAKPTSSHVTGNMLGTQESVAK